MTSNTRQVQGKPVIRAPLQRETIRVGVIGLGFGADVHVPALRRVPGVEVAAICGTDRTRLPTLARELEIPASFYDYRQMLEGDRVDAVTIASPPHLHHTMALMAIEAGKHVLCEKPMARNVAEARDMWRMAREGGVCHAIGLQMRHDPARAQMKRLLDDDYLGKLHSVSVTVYRNALADPERRISDWLASSSQAGGVLAAVGSHYIDMLRWWFGDIHWAAGTVSTAIKERPTKGRPGKRKVDADDNAAAVMRFANGGLGTLHISYTASTPVGEEIIATGSKGTLAIQDDGKLYGSQGDEPMRAFHRPHAAELPGQRISGNVRHIRAYSILAGEWVWAMRSGTDVSPSFEDGAKVQEVVDAITRSQQLSRWIDLTGNKFPV